MYFGASIVSVDWVLSDESPDPLVDLRYVHMSSSVFTALGEDEDDVATFALCFGCTIDLKVGQKDLVSHRRILLLLRSSLRSAFAVAVSSATNMSGLARSRLSWVSAMRSSQPFCMYDDWPATTHTLKLVSTGGLPEAVLSEWKTTRYCWASRRPMKVCRTNSSSTGAERTRMSNLAVFEVDEALMVP